MDEERPLLEVLLDYAVYAPVGLALSVAEELPRLTEKGKARVGSQVAVARVVGRMAVRQLQRRASPPPPAVRPEESRPEPPITTDEPLSDAAGPSAPPSPGEEPVIDPEGPVPPVAPVQQAQPPQAAQSGSVAEPPAAAAPAAPANEGTPDAGSLAIPGYDTLAASQVVQRLSSLGPEELEAVRRYETATRGRRTILHRVAQLSTDDGRASA